MPGLGLAIPPLSGALELLTGALPLGSLTPSLAEDSLSYLLPLVERIMAEEARMDGRRAAAGRPRAVVLVPTRHLRDQVRTVAKALSHAAGARFSVDALGGGLYGLSLGRMMCGESMFHEERDASKVAMAALCAHLAHWGFDFLDCQVHTDHLESLGASCLERPLFLEHLRAALAHPHRRGPWEVEPSVLAALNLEEKLPPWPASGREGARSE